MTVLVAVSAEGNIVGTIGSAVVSSSGHLRGMAVRRKSTDAASPSSWMSHGKTIARQGSKLISLDTRRTAPACHALLRKRLPSYWEITDFFGMLLIEYAKSFAQA
jgi:hypothetical protein